MSSESLELVDLLYDVVISHEFGSENSEAKSIIEEVAGYLRFANDMTNAGREHLANIVSWTRILYSDDLHRRWDSAAKTGADHVRLELLLEVERLRLILGHGAG